MAGLINPLRSMKMGMKRKDEKSIIFFTWNLSPYFHLQTSQVNKDLLMGKKDEKDDSLHIRIWGNVYYDNWCWGGVHLMHTYNIRDIHKYPHKYTHKRTRPEVKVRATGKLKQKPLVPHCTLYRKVRKLQDSGSFQLERNPNSGPLQWKLNALPLWAIRTTLNNSY